LLLCDGHFWVHDFCRPFLFPDPTIAATGYRLFTAMGLNSENATYEDENMIPISKVSSAALPQTGAPNPLREKAAQLETAFLAEMLGHAGLGDTRQSFGGGIGEEQFSSFLRQEQAAAMVKAGGIGLTESLFQALSGGHDARG
jgi:flagellar protein FlgJ